MKIFRSYDVLRQAAAARGRELKLKRKCKGGACCRSSLKIWGLLGHLQLQRKKRVAGYKLYAAKGRVKVSLRKSLRWFKRRCDGLAYGWR